MSCFILKLIRLEKPVFLVKDFNLAFGCQKAYIEPVLGDFLRNKSITLRCAFQNAAFITAEGKINAPADLFALFGSESSPLLNRIVNILFDTVNTELTICGETLGFSYFDANGKNIKIRSSGSVKESGEVSLAVKIFFSPETARQFPKDLSDLLTPESNGWMSYSLNLETGGPKPFMKLESDRFRLQFEKIEAR